MKYIKYLGVLLVIFSITLGFMVDYNNFNNIQSVVSITFFSFLLGMSCLCYVDDKLKSK
jgi:hypothetical protein